MVELKEIKISIGYEFPLYADNYGGITEEYAKLALKILKGNYTEYNIYNKLDFVKKVRNDVKQRLQNKGYMKFFNTTRYVESLMHHNKEDIFILHILVSDREKYFAICVKKSFELSGYTMKV